MALETVYTNLSQFSFTFCCVCTWSCKRPCSHKFSSSICRIGCKLLNCSSVHTFGACNQFPGIRVDKLAVARLISSVFDIAKTYGRTV